MKLENIVLDKEALEKKANELAYKAAVSELEDFYTGYNSPFKKQLRESFNNKTISLSFEIPDILAVLNKEISKKADEIANTAIAKTFLPMATELFTRIESEINLSEMLKEFISQTSYSYDDDISTDDFTLSIEQSYPDSNCLQEFNTLEISSNNKKYEVSIQIKETAENKKFFTVTSLPHQRTTHNRTMEFTLENGARLEMPFEQSILSDHFNMYLARLVIAKTRVFFDVDDFEEDLFPERDNCHC